MRLIDANRLFDAMQKIKGQFVVGIGEVVNTIDVFEQIKDAPTIDAAKVVRCKDCIFYKETLSVKGFCHNHGSIVSPNAFCSYGSYCKHRKDGEA